ncbi:MAG: 4Fe-4S ferredoxin [Sphaerochaetaceae bacterium]
MHAARNIALCTKDCLCLFVCPTGATNTENGQIDFSKCLDGCHLCVDACPSHALYLVFDRYPVKPQKDAVVASALDNLLESKVKQELIGTALAQGENGGAKLAKAIAHSNRVLAEDCAREARYMLPQSSETRKLLTELLGRRGDPGFPVDAVEQLLELLQ